MTSPYDIGREIALREKTAELEKDAIFGFLGGLATRFGLRGAASTGARAAAAEGAALAAKPGMYARAVNSITPEFIKKRNWANTAFKSALGFGAFDAGMGAAFAEEGDRWRSAVKGFGTGALIGGAGGLVRQGVGKIFGKGVGGMAQNASIMGAYTGMHSEPGEKGKGFLYGALGGAAGGALGMANKTKRVQEMAGFKGKALQRSTGLVGQLGASLAIPMGLQMRDANNRLKYQGNQHQQDPYQQQYRQQQQQYHPPGVPMSFMPQ